MAAGSCSTYLATVSQLLQQGIAELHSQGRSVLLSIGRSNDVGVHLTTSAHVTEMLSSPE